MSRFLMVFFAAIATLSQSAFTRGVDVEQYKSSASSGVSVRDGTGTCMYRTGL